MSEQSMKHTPSPWVVKFRNDHSAYISLGDPLVGEHKQFDIEFDDRYPSDVADARLIAAAPELLDAARAAMLVLAGEHDTDSARQHAESLARAAILKATGTSA